MNNDFKKHGSIGLKIKNGYFVAAMCFGNQPRQPSITNKQMHKLMQKHGSYLVQFVLHFRVNNH